MSDNTPRGLTLITIASEQQWPQIKVIRHLAPERVLILKSDDEKRSERPGSRLDQFLSRIQPTISTHSRSFKDQELHRILAELVTPDTVVNITGGTKLMAVLLLATVLNKGAKAVYFDRRTLFWFGKNDSGLPTILENQNIDDGTYIDDMDPLDLIRCQFDGRIQDEGSLIRLSSAASSLNPAQVSQLPDDKIATAIETMGGRTPATDNRGSAGEIRIAAVLLACGAKLIRTGIKLNNAESNQDRSLQEIDGVFCWNGTLWIVEVKRRKRGANPVNVLFRIIKEVQTHLSSGNRRAARNALNELTSLEMAKKGSAYFEDRFFGSAVAGINSRVLWVVASKKEKDEQFAEDTGIRLVVLDDLIRRDFSLDQL